MKNLPTHKIFQVRDRGEDKKSFWTEIGVGWENKDGSISLTLNSVPVDGKMQVRVFEPQETNERPRQDQPWKTRAPRPEATR